MNIQRTCAALVFSVAAQGASAQVQQVTPNYKVVERGRTIKIDSFGSYNPDCSSIGQTTIGLVAAPSGGRVETAEGRDYPTFPNSNVRFNCNRRRLPAAILYYHAAPNFTGTDSFTVEVVFGTGSARQLKYTVYVR